MTLTIDFSPTEEERLAAAARQEGLDPAMLVKRLVNEYLPHLPTSPQDPTLALFTRWEQEDTDMTAEEIAEENRTWGQFKTNINAERERAGARRVF